VGEIDWCCDGEGDEWGGGGGGEVVETEGGDEGEGESDEAEASVTASDGGDSSNRFIHKIEVLLCLMVL